MRIQTANAFAMIVLALGLCACSSDSKDGDKPSSGSSGTEMARGELGGSNLSTSGEDDHLEVTIDGKKMDIDPDPLTTSLALTKTVDIGLESDFTDSFIDNVSVAFGINSHKAGTYPLLTHQYDVDDDGPAAAYLDVAVDRPDPKIVRYAPVVGTGNLTVDSLTFTSPNAQGSIEVKACEGHFEGKFRQVITGGDLQGDAVSISGVFAYHND